MHENICDPDSKMTSWMPYKIDKNLYALIETESANILSPFSTTEVGYHLMTSMLSQGHIEEKHRKRKSALSILSFE